MLTAWFRLKYPHLTAGGIASSAPVDLYPGEHKAPAFYKATMATFQAHSGTCARTLQSALTRLATLGRTAAGRRELARQFRTCGPLSERTGTEALLFYVWGALATLACVDYPYPAGLIVPLPANPVAVACTQALSQAGRGQLLGALEAAVQVFTNSTGSLVCHNTSMELVGGPTLAAPPTPFAPALGSINVVWNYQVCILTTMVHPQRAIVRRR